MDALKTGTLIAETRKELNLTQKDLAQALHVSIQAVSKWERGLNFPDIILLEPLAQALGLTVSELLSGEQNAPPQEELLRDSLRVGLSQLGSKVKRWKSLFFLSAIALLSLMAWFSFSYLRNHTSFFPQKETIIVYRESTPSEQLAAKLGKSGSSINFFDITYADDITGESLQMELWTHQGLAQTWPIAKIDNADPDLWPRRGTIAIAQSVEFAHEDIPTQLHLGAALPSAIFNTTRENIPYLDSGFGYSVLREPAVVDRENGVVLVCFSLDPTGQGQWRAPGWLDNISKPTVDQGEAFLLLRLLYEYES